jgi:hypothetical protein
VPDVPLFGVLTRELAGLELRRYPLHVLRLHTYGTIVFVARGGGLGTAHHQRSVHGDGAERAGPHRALAAGRGLGGELELELGHDF